jgi:hypothetical protein
MQRMADGLPSAIPEMGSLQFKIIPLLLSVVRYFCFMTFLSEVSLNQKVIKQKSHLPAGRWE